MSDRSTHDVLGLAYLVFEVRDPEAWRRMLVDVFGATEGRSFGDAGAAYRIDERGGRIFVVPGTADDVVALGFEARSKEAMWDVAMRARDEGAFVEEGFSKDAQHRLVAELVRFEEPGGLQIEVVISPELSVDPLNARGPVDGFVTGNKGMGHVALAAEDVQATRVFFERVLGFRLSDTIRCTLRGDYRVDVSFLHVNARHHTIALTRGGGRHLHHFMLEVRSLDDLGRIHDRCCDESIPITKTMGRHPNDRVVSFYARTPSGFEVECGTGGVEIDDGAWAAATYDHVSTWGHRSPLTMKDPHVARSSAQSP